ncbi:cupredoxin domain-containing protein [Nocardioides cynanchi]|uniref:cupredoxin domain-containing protein n=1 Tax=Nocardioides cynanchi TaxID=2558918 RepID=UPI0012458E05|nr:cupredoxin domain-containing protein [Nocardioides cynanchi]
MSRRTSTALALAATALIAGGGYGASQAVAASPHVSGHSSSTRSTLATTISIRGYAFHRLATVHPGHLVKVVNHDGTTHSVTRNGGGFSVIVPAHSSRTFRAPSRAGDYRFHCMFHSTMHATLKVR